MSNDSIDIEEMKLLLKSNMFNEIEEDDEDKMEGFFTPFQIHLRLTIPVDNREYKMVLQMMGLMTYYKGHNIPADPDVCSYCIKKGQDEDEYIQVLIPKNKLEDVEKFIEEDENFNQYMKKMCEEDTKALFQEKDFTCLSVLTTAPSHFFGHILTYGATEIVNSSRGTNRAHVYIDHHFTDKEVEDYITPYKEGVMSSYDRIGIALPSMNECDNPEYFTEGKTALRSFYKICKGKNVIVDNPFFIKNFNLKWLERNHLGEEHNIDNICKNYISLRRVSKYLFGEYYSLYDLGMKLKYGKIKRNGSIGEAEFINDLVVLILKNKEKLLKLKYEREMA